MSFSEWFTGVMIVVTGVLLAEIIISVTNTIARTLLTRRERSAAQPPAVEDQVDEAHASARHALFEPEPAPRRVGVDETTHAIAAVRRAMPRDHLLATPPTIDGETLFSYLKHRARQPKSAPVWDSEGLGIWATVVEEFYTAAAADPQIAGYFVGVEMVELKRHFTRAIVTLAHTGLTVGVADDLGEAHAHLGITPEHFDQVTGYLVQALRPYLPNEVFDSVLRQLRPAVEALRFRLVRGARVS